MSGDFRTSRDLKQIFDNLDQKEDGEDDAEAIKESDVAIEAEAIKLEVAASRAGILGERGEGGRKGGGKGRGKGNRGGKEWDRKRPARMTETYDVSYR